MTTSPAPATMRAARELQVIAAIDDLLSKTDPRSGLTVYARRKLIAAALVRARREALTEAAEVARNEMLNPAFEWREHNLACDVIARAIEAMRE